MTDILAVGAHPDDVEIAAGGTLVKMRKLGHSMLLCDATDGEPTPRGDRETRLAEAAEAAKRLGARRVTLDMPNRYLQDTLENRHKLALVIRAERPDILLAPYPGGDHPDHTAAARIAEAARFYAKLAKTDMHGQQWPGDPWWTPRLYYYLGLGVLTKKVLPSFVVDITGEYEEKENILASYRTQAEVVERLTQASSYFGQLAGVKHAEGFYSDEVITIADLFCLRPHGAGEIGY